MKKAKTYDQQTAKFIAVVAQSMPDLSGEAIQAWIENPAGLKRVLSSVLCSSKKKRHFEKWLTVKLGTGPKNALDFCRIFSDRRIKIDQWAETILQEKSFKVADKETEVDLVRVATFELGFKWFASREEIYSRARKFGLELCPPEVGPQLALQNEAQYDGEWIMVAMEPVPLSGGILEILSVKADYKNYYLGPTLRAYGGQPEGFWNPEQQWVFVLPRK